MFPSLSETDTHKKDIGRHHLAVLLTGPLLVFRTMKKFFFTVCVLYVHAMGKNIKRESIVQKEKKTCSKEEKVKCISSNGDLLLGHLCSCLFIFRPLLFASSLLSVLSHACWRFSVQIFASSTKIRTGTNC